MGMLNYAATISLDGYVANSNTDFQWAAPSDEVFAHHLERMSHVTTEILGRRAYSLMKYWSTVAENAEHSAAEVEFAKRWLAIDKVVVSSTLSKSNFWQTGLS
ncbi:dihydrofolate reductase family protein [Enteractinococcus coprophilus]|uniref:dihydrofolate reductase family protein n=1 Tax=Enteractinococcus coprophilus TaxID=1027633 RepID=UPI001B85DE1C